MAADDNYLKTPTAGELVALGVKLRSGTDLQSRGHDSLQRFLEVPNHAMFLYTSEDKLLNDYIREHWAALDGLSGESCDIHISMLQLLGSEDYYSQLEDIRSMPGLESVEPKDLPALHIWSAKAHCTIPLCVFDSQARIRDALRRVFTIVSNAGGAISAEQAAHILSKAPEGDGGAPTTSGHQSVQRSFIGGDLVQISQVFHSVKASDEREPLELHTDLRTSSKQTIEAVNAGGGVSQFLDSASPIQATPNARTLDLRDQTEAAAPADFLDWGKARKLGIGILALAILAWAAFRYLSGR